jgi:hypothetical protein
VDTYAAFAFADYTAQRNIGRKSGFVYLECLPAATCRSGIVLCGRAHWLVSRKPQNKGEGAFCSVLLFYHEPIGLFGV